MLIMAARALSQPDSVLMGFPCHALRQQHNHHVQMQCASSGWLLLKMAVTRPWLCSYILFYFWHTLTTHSCLHMGKFPCFYILVHIIACCQGSLGTTRMGSAHTAQAMSVRTRAGEDQQ